MFLLPLGMCKATPEGLPFNTLGKAPLTFQPLATKTLLICSANVQPSWSPYTHEIITGDFGLFTKYCFSRSKSIPSMFRGFWRFRTSNKFVSALAVRSCCSLNSISTFCCAALAFAASFRRFATLPFSVSKSPVNVRLLASNCLKPRFAYLIFSCQDIYSAIELLVTLLPDFHNRIVAISTNASKIICTIKIRLFCFVANAKAFLPRQSLIGVRRTNYRCHCDSCGCYARTRQINEVH